jgi:hypothetical protein
MIVHSCCCIWNFVMIGLNQIRIGFKNLLKNGFEILEKGKKRKVGFFWFSAQFSRGPLSFPRPAPAWAKPSRPAAGPAARAAPLFQWQAGPPCQRLS